MFDKNKCIKFLEEEIAIQLGKYEYKKQKDIVRLLDNGEMLFRGYVSKIDAESKQMIIIFRSDKWFYPRIGTSEGFRCLPTDISIRNEDPCNLNISLNDLLKYTYQPFEIEPISYFPDPSKKYIIGIFSIINSDEIISDILRVERTIVYITINPPPVRMLENLICFMSESSPHYDSHLSKYLVDIKFGEKKSIQEVSSDDVKQLVINEMDSYRTPIIQGPPGSGKSYQIANIANELCSKNFSVLIVALTNRALMEIAKQPPLKDLLKKSKVQKTALRNSEINELPQLMKLDEVSPVKGGCHLASCFMASGSPVLAADSKYDYVIVDEASQIILPMLSCTSCLGYKCSIFGDIEQLPPVVEMDKSKIGERKYSMYVNGLLSLSSVLTTYQINQTRRLPELSANCTSVFYDYSLSSLSEEKTSFSSNLFDGRAIKPGVFIIFANIEVKSKVPSIALELITSLLNDIRRQDNRAFVAILAHTRFFVRSTLRELHKIGQYQEKNKLLIDTVHRTQGLTCDYTIYTHMRSKDNNLFNVATSRAKKITFIILDKKYEKDDFLYDAPKIRKFIRVVKENGMFVSLS